MTLAELHDHRLDVLSAARETLSRARTECQGLRGNLTHLLDVTVAMARLRHALRDVDNPGSDKDKTVALCEERTGQLVALVRDRMGDEAAEHVASGQGDFDD
jgi:hypothetical protein